ncbi:hypothetical protein DM02DRAFT_616752 [Periconia macrospinosa]|uniref:GPI anchored protein n=1 Tax=Periconia macrospinosa TaxID=97972 RepID=A0A2V1DFY2_9PLEO|nr:hypothetical protein DM02DRAFT_616752 [Periconia macrospinosa]
MKWSLVLIAAVSALSQAPDAQITPGPELRMRQDNNADPALLGWVSTSGASRVSDRRTCDFPATLSRSGSFAQCCAPSGACNFYTSCSGNVLVAPSTSVPCEQGVCNTGVIVASVGVQSGGVSNLACWATELAGTAAFSLVRNVDSSAIAAPTSGSSSQGGSRSGSTSTRASSSSGGSASSPTSGSGATSPTTSNAAFALADVQQPFTGIVGLMAGLLALL